MINMTNLQLLRRDLQHKAVATIRSVLPKKEEDKSEEDKELENQLKKIRSSYRAP